MQFASIMRISLFDFFIIVLVSSWSCIVLGFNLLSLDKLNQPLFFKLISVNFLVVLIHPRECLLDVLFHVSAECLLLADAFQHRVKSVLDLVLGATNDVFCYLRPLVPDSLVGLQQKQVLVWGPGLAADLWRQKVNPTLATLFSLSFGGTNILINLIGDLLPLFLAPLSN